MAAQETPVSVHSEAAYPKENILCPFCPDREAIYYRSRIAFCDHVNKRHYEPSNRLVNNARRAFLNSLLCTCDHCPKLCIDAKFKWFHMRGCHPRQLGLPSTLPERPPTATTPRSAPASEQQRREPAPTTPRRTPKGPPLFVPKPPPPRRTVQITNTDSSGSDANAGEEEPLRSRTVQFDSAAIGEGEPSHSRTVQFTTAETEEVQDLDIDGLIGGPPGLPAPASRARPAAEPRHDRLPPPRSRTVTESPSLDAAHQQGTPPANARPRRNNGRQKGKQQRHKEVRVELSAAYTAEIRDGLTTTSHTISGEDLGFDSDEDCSRTLTAFFTQGLYNHHHAWREPMREVVSAILRVMLRSQSVTADQQWASLALTVLPGVIRFLSITRRPTPIDLFRFAGEEQGEYAVQRIIRIAATLKPYVESVRAEINSRPRTNKPLSKISLKEKLKRRVCRLFEDGRIGAAARVVDSVEEVFRQNGYSIDSDVNETAAGDVTPIVPLTLERSQEIIAELNPPAREEDELPDPEQDEAHIASNKDLSPITFDTDIIREVIKRLPAGSASGASGWTFSTIRFLYREKNQDLEGHLELLVRFCRAFLAGRVCQDQLLLSRAVLIPKDVTKYRPLGIGEAWYRFGCRAIMRVVAPSVGLKLAPLQLGCGVASGCAIGAAQALCALEAAPDSAVLIKTDFANAFNSIPRRAIYDGLAEYCPGLLRWFRWAYGDSRPLVDHHGQELGRSSTGCRQGDPLSPLLFCVAMQPALIRLQEQLKELSNIQLEDDDPTSTFFAFLLTAYMDDVTIAVPKGIAHRVCRLLPEVFSSVGLTLNPNKCAVIGRAALSGESSSSETYPFPVLPDGAVVLGIPVGSKTFRAMHLADKVNSEFSDPFRYLWELNLPPAIAFHLIKACFNARPQFLSTFLLGTSQRVNQLMRRFDRRIDCEIARLGGIRLEFNDPNIPADHRIVAMLRSLPTHLGGLGVHRHTWVQGQKLALQLHERIQKFFDKHHPPGFLKLKRDLVLGEGDVAGIFPAFDPELEFATRDDFDPDPARTPQEPSLQEKVDLISELTSDSLISRVAESSRTKAAWLRSNRFEGSGRWLMTAADKKQDINKQFSDDEFRTALRWRLLRSPFEELYADGREIMCPACSTLVNHNDPFHCLNCPHLGFLSQRHSVLLRVLHDFIRKRVPQSVIRTTLCYHDAVDGHPIERYPDLTVSLPTQGTKVLDLCVANAACPTRVNQTVNPSHRHDLSAADFWEAKKRCDVAHTREANDGTLVPFVLEATGRLGAAAVRYIHDITVYHPPPPGTVEYIPPPSRILQDQMSTVVTKAQATLAMVFHRLLREANQFPEELA